MYTSNSAELGKNITTEYMKMEINTLIPKYYLVPKQTVVSFKFLQMKYYGILIFWLLCLFDSSNAWLVDDSNAETNRRSFFFTLRCIPSWHCCWYLLSPQLKLLWLPHGEPTLPLHRWRGAWTVGCHAIDARQPPLSQYLLALVDFPLYWHLLIWDSWTH